MWVLASLLAAAHFEPAFGFVSPLRTPIAFKSLPSSKLLYREQTRRAALRLDDDDCREVLKVSAACIAPMKSKDGGPTFVPALLDETDLVSTSSLLVDCLSPPRALLGEGDLFAWERFVLEGFMNFFNSVSRALNLYETELGLRQRMDNRLRSLATAALDIHLPDVDLQSFVERPSYQDRRSIVVLMLDDDSGEVVGAAEVALQPCDGQLPTNFPNLPFTSAATAAGKVKVFPYLCNVAVAPAARRRGVAKRLLEICEEIAARQWNHDRIYLHVGSSNTAAVQLYEASGFEAVPDDKRIPTSALGKLMMDVLAEENLMYLYKDLHVYSQRPFISGLDSEDGLLF